MNRFLLKNDTTENVSARVTVSPSDELGNLGHDAATVIEGDRLTTCLAPTAVALPDPTNHRSQCFELNDEGRYAVEINGVIQPFSFSPTDLLDCFNGQHESQIRFLECSENVCLNATDNASTGGVWGEATITINGVTYPEIRDVDAAVFIGLNTDSEFKFIWTNKTKEFQRIEIKNADFSTEDSGWGENTNPTVKYDVVKGTITFCLAPLEEKPEISCVGATPSAHMTNGTGEWDIELNGQLFTSPDGLDIGDFIQQTPVLDSEIEGLGEGDFLLSNKNSSNPQRVRLIPKNSSSWDIHPSNENPTLIVDSDDTISVCLTPKRRPITCDGASELFAAKSRVDANVIEVSVDGGPWTSMYLVSEINASMLPGNPSADIIFSLKDDGPRRVRVRTTHDIGLYVNPNTGFDQINTNTAYTLYDRNGLVIDPLDPNNHDYSGREFDDGSTTDDFAVYFAEAEFCLVKPVFTIIAIAKEVGEGTSFKNQLMLGGLPNGTTIHWGDGTTLVAVAGMVHTKKYSSNGLYNVTLDLPNENIFSTLSVMGCADEIINWTDLPVERITVTSGTIRKLPDHLPTTVTSMEMMFYDTPNFNQDISMWDTSKIVNMRATFYLCYAFNQDLSGWDVSKVTNYADFDTAASAWTLPRPNFG